MITLILLSSLLAPGLCLTGLEAEEQSLVKVFPIRDYPRVALIRWNVPLASQSATFTFLANTSSSCDPNIKIWLRGGALPVLSPDGGKFSRAMTPLLVNQTELRLEGGYRTVSVVGPAPGHWYAVLAAHNTCNEDEMMVAAKGLYRVEEDVISIVPSYHNYQDIRTLFSVTSGGRQTFRFHVPDTAWRTEITISDCKTVGISTGTNCPVLLAASPLSLPGPTATNISCAGLPSQDFCFLSLSTMADTDNFVTVTSLASRTVSLAISIRLVGCRDSLFSEGAMLVNAIKTSLVCGDPNRRPLKILFHPSTGQESLPDCGQVARLTRRSEGRGGSAWSLPGSVGDKQVLHLNTNTSSTLSFNMDTRDLGGTLSIELGILTLGPPNEVRDVVGCLSPGYRDLPRDDGRQYVCSPSSRLISVTRSGIHRELVQEKVMVVHPVMGDWHLSLLSHCSMAGQGRSSLCSNQAVTAAVSVRSGLCPQDCGRGGECRRVVTPGLPILSVCSCQSGHRGPDCSDRTRAESDYTQLTVRLILSITNLSLLPGIMLAVYRRHYTESLVYWCHLVAGCLHHACQETGLALCAGHSAVLQYSNTVTQLLSVWVTLLAMAHLPQSLRSILHITGGLALATVSHLQYSLMSGCLIVSSLVLVTVSWLSFSILHRDCQPSSKFLVLHTIPGLVLLVAGEAVDSLHQSVTSHCVHHLTTGVAIMILLPSTVNNFQVKRDQKLDGSSLSVIRNDTPSLKESGVRTKAKKPKKDVSVSFKQDDDEMESVDKKETTNGYSSIGYSAINGGRKENDETNPDNQNDEEIRKDEAETNENSSNTQL